MVKRVLDRDGAVGGGLAALIQNGDAGLGQVEGAVRGGEAVALAGAVGQHVEGEALERGVGRQILFLGQQFLLVPVDARGDGKAADLGGHLPDGAAIDGHDSDGEGEDVDGRAVGLQCGIGGGDRAVGDGEGVIAGIDGMLPIGQVQPDHIAAPKVAALVRLVEGELVIDDDAAHVVAVAVELGPWGPRLGRARRGALAGQLRDQFGGRLVGLGLGLLGFDVDAGDGRGDQLIGGPQSGPDAG